MFSTIVSLLALVSTTAYKAPSFVLWAAHFNRSYHSITEQDYRHSVYIANARRIAVLNKGHYNSTLDVNQFADITPQEFSDRYQWLTVARR